MKRKRTPTLLNRAETLRRFRESCAKWLQPGQRLRLPRGLVKELEAKLAIIIEAEAASYRPTKRPTGKSITLCQHWGCKHTATQTIVIPNGETLRLCDAHAAMADVKPKDRRKTIVEHQPELITP